MLKKITGAFTRALGEDSYVFRIGGDEFVILFEAGDYRPLLRLATDELARETADSPAVRVSIGVIAAG